MDHVRSEGEAYSPLFVQFLYYFNVERDYFECHEVLEELWLEEGRSLLYQGLLQVAVALYHFRNDNVNGARKLFQGALDKLANYPGDSLGIDLGRIREESRHYLKKLNAYETSPFPFYDLNIVILDSALQEKVEKYREERGASERKGRDL
ncbi:DUF309 domain-containing protein [Paludifilum halophilum]|uniref:DUF309 domain-containing protein n=1 Tax=Paludifilum halophilum TaxID=1642702 RepID=A0A235B6G1_9BACL|nr:DUF309 domain-containing protein [Paludifilum halophilum]OYD07477.1 hypothetical protein CHM34_11290 [Paludifilum halophilum]